MKRMYDPIPFRVEYEKKILASNSNYREDLIYLRLGNMAESQNAK